jgi:hypothetical protein
MANPRGFLASSGNSRPRVTVEKRTKTGVLTPADLRKCAYKISNLRLLPIACMGVAYFGERGYVFCGFEITKCSTATLPSLAEVTVDDSQ